MSISLIISGSVFTCVLLDTRLECNLCMCLHRFAGSSQSHEYKCSQSPMHSTSEHWLRQLSSLHVSESFSMIYEINSPRNKKLIFQFKCKFKISISLHKMCENTGFPQLVFARITIESMILSLYSKYRSEKTRILAYFTQCFKGKIFFALMQCSERYLERHLG